MLPMFFVPGSSLALFRTTARLVYNPAAVRLIQFDETELDREQLEAVLHEDAVGYRRRTIA